jgi:predicted nucleic acid-binding protein
VVLQELVAGAPDEEAVKRYDAAKRQYERERKLLVPTAEDWFLSGKVLNSLLRGLKSVQGGKTPKLQSEEKHRIIRDILIARSVKRVNGLLVTDNIDDFKRIKRFCNVRVKSGRDFFGLS